MKLERAISW